MSRMHILTKKLEESLGPDTGDLSLRIGIRKLLILLHCLPFDLRLLTCSDFTGITFTDSGPVTAGVLRGERARFQLFGDTVNTAARLESCGEGGRILVSSQFAGLLQKAGKSAWLEERQDKIEAKGKGELTAYWLIGSSSGERRSVASVASNDGDASLLACGNRKDRLVDWCCQQLELSLKQVVARRNATSTSRRSVQKLAKSASSEQFGTNFFDEVKEIISLPEYDAEAAARQCDPATIVLDTRVREELRVFVSLIEATYNDNYFHNFEHVSPQHECFVRKMIIWN